MNRIIILLLAMLAFSIYQAEAQHSQIMVKPDQATLSLYKDKESVSRWLLATCSQLKAKGIEAKVTAMPRAKHSSAFDFLYTIDVSPATAADEALSYLKSTGHFAFAEKLPTGTIQTVVPNDAAFSRQWGWENTGTQTPLASKTTADTRIQAAWDYTTGSDSVIVAVVDAGIRLDHPEFRGRLWVNPDEIPGNQVDDDGNEFVDDVQGWNFAYNNNNLADDIGHGTQVAGVLAANGNNSIGFAGVDWHCRIMPVKITKSNGLADYASMIYGIIYAVDEGAHVINMSVGGYTPFAYMDSAVAYAKDNNVVLVAAAGNENVNAKNYPSSIEPAISVGSSNPDDTRSSPFIVFYKGKDTSFGGSNFGSQLDIVAPGNYMYMLDYIDTSNYSSYSSGTSFASPMVAGAAALLKAYYPARTATEIRNMILNGADDQVGNPAYDLPGRDDYYGKGRLNISRAFTASTKLGVKTLPADGLTLYPNPAGDEITVRLENQTGEGRVSVCDMLGRDVYSGPVSGNTIKIDLSGTAPGCYFIRYSNGEVTHTQKFIRR